MKRSQGKSGTGLLLAVLLSLFFLVACAGPSPALRSGDIAKAKSDFRSYRHLSLGNGLRVLLVSDPRTARAAAAMNITAGSRDEPSAYPGLAHLLEHALFLGTKNYPKPYEFNNYISDNGGVYNAVTAFEHTSYYFALDAHALAPALDRFAEFFSAPLLLPERIAEEVKVVDAEYQSRLRSEEQRLLDVFRTQLNPAHPYARFTVGSADTLAGSAAAVADFYRRFYTAPRMTLVLMGPSSLSQLERLVLERFHALPGGEAQSRGASASLFVPDTLPRRVFLESIRDLRKLRLVFPIAGEASGQRDEPLRYIAEMLGDEGEGSLLSYLKRKGWAQGLSAGLGLQYQEGATFDVNIWLTQAGLQSLEAVAAVVFGTLAKIRAEGLVQWRLAERRRTAELAWQFREWYSAEHEVWRLARNLQKYPLREVLRGDYLAEDFSGQDLAAQLDFLVPGNCLWLVSAPQAAGEQSSHRYAVPYREEKPFSAALSARLRTAVAGEVQLPPPNPYLPSASALRTAPARFHPAASPKLVFEGERLQLWHLADQESSGFRAHAYFDLHFPDASGTPEKAAFNILLARVLADEWNEKVWPAARAGLHVGLSPSRRGLTLSLQGFPNYQPKLLGELVQVLRAPALTSASITRGRETLLQRWGSTGQDAPYRRLLEDVSQALLPGKWPEAELAAALEHATPEQLRSFARASLDGVRILGLVQGNMQLPAALQMASLADSISAGVPGFSSPTRVGRLADGERWRWSRQLPHRDAAILLYLQAPDDTDQSRAFTALSAQLLEADFFREMRIERQLGYVVFSAYYPLLNVPGIVFTMQSPSATVQELEGALEAFLREATSEKSRPAPRYFESQRQVILQSLRQRPENGSAAAARNWRAILFGDREFARRQGMVRAIEDARWQDWWDFHRSLAEASRSRREILLSASASAVPAEDSTEKPHTLDSPQALWRALSSWYSR